MSGSNALNGSLDMLEGCTLSGRLKETWRGQSIPTWYMMAALKKRHWSMLTPLFGQRIRLLCDMHPESVDWLFSMYIMLGWSIDTFLSPILASAYDHWVRRIHAHRLIWSMCPFIKTHHYIICFVRPRHSKPGIESYCWPSTDLLSW